MANREPRDYDGNGGNGGGGGIGYAGEGRVWEIIRNLDHQEQSEERDMLQA